MAFVSFEDLKKVRVIFCRSEVIVESCCVCWLAWDQTEDIEPSSSLSMEEPVSKHNEVCGSESKVNQEAAMKLEDY